MGERSERKTRERGRGEGGDAGRRAREGSGGVRRRGEVARRKRGGRGEEKTVMEAREER